MARHVRKGDTVMVRSGDLKGQSGVLMRVDTKKQRVFIKGLNLVTRHMRPTKVNPNGGIVQREAGIHISKVSPLVDGKAVRVRFVKRKDGAKVRVAALKGRKPGKELGVVSSTQG